MVSPLLHDELTLAFVLLAYAVLINMLTAMLYWLDKRAAQANLRRISERSLIFCAIIGGSLGVFWASKKFQHKTKKQPFSNYMLAIQVVHMGLIGAALFLSFNALIG